MTCKLIPLRLNESLDCAFIAELHRGKGFILPTAARHEQLYNGSKRYSHRLGYTNSAPNPLPRNSRLCQPTSKAGVVIADAGKYATDKGAHTQVKDDLR
jgi:hypothetical protein